MSTSQKLRGIGCSGFRAGRMLSLYRRGPRLALVSLLATVVLCNLLGRLTPPVGDILQMRIGPIGFYFFATLIGLLTPNDETLIPRHDAGSDFGPRPKWTQNL